MGPPTARATTTIRTAATGYVSFGIGFETIVLSLRILIVAGMPNHPAKFMVLGMHNNQQAIIGRPTNPIVQRAWFEIVLKPMDKVTFAEAQIRHKFSTLATPTIICRGRPPMIFATSTISLIEGYAR